MTDEEIQQLMMRVVDGVASPGEEQMLVEATQGQEKWQQELRAFRTIKEVTDNMRFKELPDSYWEGYWAQVYSRVERSVGWILLSVGAVVLLAYVSYMGLSQMYTDPGVSIVIKVGVSAAVLGAAILIVSIVRERLYARKHERYEREVER